MRNMPDIENHIIVLGKALANDKRVKILHWLRDPRQHFPKQTSGSRVLDGVCSLLIAQKLRISAATASEHLGQLKRAGLLVSKRVGTWTFYRRDNVAIARALNLLAHNL